MALLVRSRISEVRVMARWRKWMKGWLEVYKRVPVVALACDQSGISRATFYAAMHADSGWRKRVAEAKAEAIERLEYQAWKRATALENPSERLLIFLLQSHAPQTYGKKLVEVSGPGGGPVQVTERREWMVKVASDPEGARLLTELSVKVAALELQEDDDVEDGSDDETA